MAKTVVALYDSFDDAQNVVQDLIQGGFRRDDIGLAAGNSLPNDEKGQYASSTGRSAIRIWPCNCSGPRSSVIILANDMI